MGWLFVPGLADSNSELNWPSEMPTGLSVAWNGKALQPRSWSRVSKIAAFRRFLSGLTFDPSTAERGVESWISSLRDSRASHSASPDSDGEPKIRVTSGPTSPASSESASLESSSLKTFRGCSQLGLPMGDMPTSTSSPIYEDWVTKLRLASSRRRKSAPLTSANGSSSWPTAQSHDSQGPKSPEQIAAMRANGYGVRNLNEEVAMWPTPVANDDNKTPEAHLAKKPGRTVVTSLNIVASQMWPTPRSEDSESAGNHPGATDSLTGATGMWPTPNTPTGGPNTKSTTTHTGGMDLDGAAALWQTPASDSFRSRGGDRKDEMGLDQQARWMTPSANEDAAGTVDGQMQRMLTHQAAQWMTPTVQDAGKATKRLRDEHQNNLTAEVKAWATPTSRDWKGSYSDEAMVRKDGKSRMDQVESQAIHLIDYSPRFPQALQTMSDGQPSSESDPTSRRPSASTRNTNSASPSRLLARRLNPRFVEALMGWPTGWTSLAPLDCGSRETAWSHWPQLMRSELSRLGWGTPDDNC